MWMGTRSVFAGFVGVLLLTLTGCTAKNGTFQREDLFTLDIGRLEGEIDLYSDLTLREGQGSSIAMTDGLVYITNGAGRKITRYNSYGDLLFMIYNEETNPPLLELQTIEGMSRAITRWAVAYPLQNPGAIAIDSRKNIFVADRLAADRHRYDRDADMLYDTLLLHFDVNGQFVEYLGRQGKGGAPFPPIEHIYLSQNDDIVVVSKAGGDYIVYWFSSNGVLRHEISFKNDAVPIPGKSLSGTGESERLFASPDGIAIAPDEEIIYVKVDYYREVFDETTGILSGNVPAGCSLWLFSIDANDYVGETNIPFYENNAVANRRRGDEPLFYSLLGALKNRNVVFYFPSTNGYSILSLKAGETARQRKRGFIDVSAEELEYSDFTLSSNGIISALLSTEWEAKVVWWQTDIVQ
jgi:hypothetical protein